MAGDSAGKRTVKTRESSEEDCEAKWAAFAVEREATTAHCWRGTWSARWVRLQGVWVLLTWSSSSSSSRLRLSRGVAMTSSAVFSEADAATKATCIARASSRPHATGLTAVEMAMVDGGRYAQEVISARERYQAPERSGFWEEDSQKVTTLSRRGKRKHRVELHLPFAARLPPGSTGPLNSRPGPAFRSAPPRLGETSAEPEPAPRGMPCGHCWGSITYAA